MRQLFEIYRPDDFADFERRYGETPWMVHIAGPDETLLYADAAEERDARTPHTRESAFAAAKEINDRYERAERENPSSFDPFAQPQATVFFHGVPKKAPLEEGDPVEVRPGRPRVPHQGLHGFVGAIDQVFIASKPYLVEFKDTSGWYGLDELETLRGPKAVMW